MSKWKEIIAVALICFMGGGCAMLGSKVVNLIWPDKPHEIVVKYETGKEAQP